MAVAMMLFDNIGLIITICLIPYGFLFAINSSVHSYLILAYASRDQVSLDVGFYYMANAGGRLLGTILSGIIFQYFGLVSCLLTASSMIFISTFTAKSLPGPSED
jgi:predicted MFS family arabinose efflux permease